LIGIVVAIAAAVTLLMPEFVRSRYEAVLVHLLDRQDNDGLILLNSPQIFPPAWTINRK